LYKTLLEKLEELQKQLDEQKEDNKNSFIEAKKNYEDKGMEAVSLPLHHCDCCVKLA